MLLILTVGLVLAGIVLLVIGLLQHEPGFIFLSMACAGLAALTLVVFNRLAKRSARSAMAGDSATGAGAPVRTSQTAPAPRSVDDTAVVPVPADAPGSGDQAPAAWSPTPWSPASTPSSERAPQRVESAPVAVPVPAGGGPDRRNANRAPSPGAGAPGGWDGDDEVDEDFVFPIEDYDDLRVAEILPILGELEQDELIDVRDREAAGKARGTLLRRIETLLSGPNSTVAGRAGETGQSVEESAPEAPAALGSAPDADAAAGESDHTDAIPIDGGRAGSVDAHRSAADNAVADNAVADDPWPRPVGARSAPAEEAEKAETAAPSAAASSAPAAPRRRAPRAASTSRPARASRPAKSAEPIPNSESLRVAEILPLLSTLSANELAVVENRERAGANRTTVLNRIQRLRAGPVDTTRIGPPSRLRSPTSSRRLGDAPAEPTTAGTPPALVPDPQAAAPATAGPRRSTRAAKAVPGDPATTRAASRPAPATRTAPITKRGAKRARPGPFPAPGGPNGASTPGETDPRQPGPSTPGADPRRRVAAPAKRIGVKRSAPVKQPAPLRRAPAKRLVPGERAVPTEGPVPAKRATKKRS